MAKWHLLTALLVTVVAGTSCTAPQGRSTLIGKENRAAGSGDEDNFFDDEAGEATPVKSKEYKPKQNAAQLSTRGYASWYGRELQGKPTASGEIFDMNDYTAAHRNYPMGSIVLVRNLKNNKKQIVRINDRGPYVEGRIIDVSYAAARDLDFAEAGVTEVEIEVIQQGKDNFLSKAKPPVVKPEPVELPDEEPVEEEDDDSIMAADETGDYVFADNKRPAGYTIQIGAFQKRVNAEKHRQEMSGKYKAKAFIASRGKWHFVWLGDYKEAEKARKFRDRLRMDGVDVMYRGKI